VLFHFSLLDDLSFLYSYSFPTRRSSDLVVAINKAYAILPGLTIPKSIIILHTFLSFVVLAITSIIVGLAYRFVNCKLKARKNILIYGAGESGIMTQYALASNMDKNTKIVAFIDDDLRKVGNSINGTRGIETGAVDKHFIQKHQINEIIISIQNTASSKLRTRVETFIDFVPTIKVVPPIEQWISGELNVNQIKPIKLEDLLDRSPINIENKKLQHEFKGKVLMVTGAAGSIGSEIARQLSKFNFKKLILVDIAESALYDLQQEFKQEGVKEFVAIVADVRDQFGIENVISTYRPNILYHAAAYNRVPLMEENHYEDVKINVGGSRTLARMAMKYEVDKYGIVTTDKAVNPTHVIGDNKRTAEIYIGSLQNAPENPPKII